MKKELNIVGRRKIFLSISAALILIGIICNIILGTQLDVEFKGGTLIKYSYDGTIDEPELDAFLTEQLGRATCRSSMSLWQTSWIWNKRRRLRGRLWRGTRTITSIRLTPSPSLLP